MQFHRLGAKIVCVDKDEVGNNETVDRIKAEGGQAVGFKVNITDKEQVMMMHTAVRDRMGPVDILVNNAAVVDTTLFADPDADDTISEIVNTNLLGQIWVRTCIINKFGNYGGIVVYGMLGRGRYGYTAPLT